MNANRKMKGLPRGWKFEPLYSKCPDCGCDLTKLPEGFKVLPETLQDLIRENRRNRTRMEKRISITRKKLFIAAKHIGQSLADKCLRMWK